MAALLRWEMCAGGGEKPDITKSHRSEITYEANDKTYSGQKTPSEKARSPKCGELRECGEGVSSRYKPEMRRMGHAQGSVVRTDEADDETYSGQVTL